MYPRLLTGVAGGALLLCLSCSSQEPTDHVEATITGGELAGPEHDAVVLVSTTLGEGVVLKLGSGTLIAPNLIATALHVISASPPSMGFACDANGNDLSGGAADLQPPVAPEQVEVFLSPTVPEGPPDAVGVEIVSSGSMTFCQNDVAFVVLDRPLSPSPVPVRRRQVAELGEVVTVVGFGDEPGDTRPTRRARDVSVKAVAQWPRTFTVSVGPCPGDSGGPALSAEGELVGVFSTVSANCNGASAAPKYTDIGYFSSLVERAFSAAGADPPWPNGAGGASGAAGTGGETQVGPPDSDPEDPGGCQCNFKGHRSDWWSALALLLVACRGRRSAPK